MTKDIIVNWMKNRINKNKNVILVINGATGTGKTYKALDIALKASKELNTNFTISENLDFNFAKLLQKTMLPQNQKAGTAFVFEEVGVMGGGASSREWQSKSNKWFHAFMQTTRHRRQILIFTCPSFSFLDAGARNLCHMQMTMKKIDFTNKISIAKPYIIQTNQRTGKQYFKYLRINQDGHFRVYKAHKSDLLPDDIVKEYEALKEKYTSKLNNEIIREDNEAKLKNKESKGQEGKLARDNRVIAYREAGLSLKEVAKKENLCINTVVKIIKLSKAKQKEQNNDVLGNNKLDGAVLEPYSTIKNPV